MTKIDGVWRVPMIRKWKWQSKMRPWMKMGPTAKDVMVIWLMVTSLVFKQAKTRAVTPKLEELEVIGETIEPSEAGKVKVVLMVIWLMLIRKGQSEMGSTAKDEMIIVLMLLLMLVENASARAVSPSFDLKSMSIRYYDEFGQETTAPFEGGKVKVEVPVTGINPGGEVEAFVGEKVFKGKVASDNTVTFEWTFGKETQFGNYEIGSSKQRLFTLHFYIKKCPDDQCKGVCIVTKEGEKCNKPELKWCVEQKHDGELKTCPDIVSLCRQIADGKWEGVLSSQTHPCGAKTTQIGDENGDQLPFMKAFKASKFTFGCKPDSEMNGGTAVWKIFAYNGTKVHEEPAVKCYNHQDFKLPEKIFDIGGVWLLTLEVNNSVNGIMHRSINRILLVTFPPPNRFECKGNKNDGEYSDVIGCNFTEGFSKAFSATITCTCDGKTETAPGMEIRVFQSGMCDCSVSVFFKNMYFLDNTITDVPYQAKVQVKMRPPTKPPGDGTGSSSSTVLSTGAIIGISAAIIFILCAAFISVLIVFCVVFKPKRDEQKRVDKELREDLKGIGAAPVANSAPAATSTPAAAEVHETKTQKEAKEAKNKFAAAPSMKRILQLEEEAKRTGKLKQDEKGLKFADDFNNQYAAKEQMLIEGGKEIRKIENCRYGGGLDNVLIKSHVVVEGVQNPFSLNMSKLYDYHGNPTFLCQAPLKAQFFDHWMAIMQQKIGVIGMVGKLEETKSYRDPDPKKKGEILTVTKTKIDLYFNPEAFGSVFTVAEFEEGKGRRFEIETHGVSSGKNKTYMLHVTHKAADGKVLESFDVKLLHLEDWPDHNVPNDPGSTCLGISKLMKLQQEAANKERPGMLVHCSAGIQRSVSVVIIIISVQCWMETKKTDPLGILDVIRKNYRMQALSTTHVGSDKVLVQLQLILKAVTAICKIKSQEEAGDEKHDMGKIRASFETTQTLHEDKTVKPSKSPSPRSNRNVSAIRVPTPSASMAGQSNMGGRPKRSRSRE